ncbi:MAG: hypothetical protein JNK65_01685, partial [Deltaproteobacteria bacterium]|nr:hypothetical protein [Deltaproteobacteria bacterium]
MSCFISKNGLALFIQYPTLNKTNLRESAAVGLEEATRMFESRIRKTIEILQSSSQSYKLY